MSTVSDDESERIRRYITVTKYGRNSVPTIKTETDRKKITGSADRRQNRQTTENMGGVNLTGQQVTQLLQNRSTTIIGTDSLPKFRGRRRQHDPTFEDQNSFRQHLSLVNNYIGTLNNPGNKKKSKYF